MLNYLTIGLYFSFKIINFNRPAMIYGTELPEKNKIKTQLQPIMCATHFVKVVFFDGVE